MENLNDTHSIDTLTTVLIHDIMSIIQKCAEIPQTNIIDNISSVSCISSQNVLSPTQHNLPRLIIRLKRKQIQTKDITTPSTNENIPKTLSKVKFITDKILIGKYE
jgi:hypothetical protein